MCFGWSHCTTTDVLVFREVTTWPGAEGTTVQGGQGHRLSGTGVWGHARDPQALPSAELGALDEIWTRKTVQVKGAPRRFRAVPVLSVSKSLPSEERDSHHRISCPCRPYRPIHKAPPVMHVLCYPGRN